MDINKICPGCMKELANRESLDFCPNCGYNLKNMASESHQLQPFTILAGKYLVGKVIGEGGFGISYLGLDLNLEVPLAIKEFYPNGFVTRESNNTTKVTMYAGKNESDVNHWRDSFINEAKNLAKFSNLNGIVEVRDFFNENNTAYIVMEYIDGMTLKSYLKENKGKIPVDKTLEMMEPVIRSLSRVHDAGMIHRDISPDNIMITKHGGMKLLDFGAAREYAGNAEKSLSIMLKPGYAPEEQYRSKGKQGPWSDVYALCATIYKCITGKTPVESMERMREDTLQKPSALGVKMSPELEDTLMRGMAVYAENRIQSMDELHKLLYGGVGAVTSAKTVSETTKSEAKNTEAKMPDVKMPNIKMPDIKMPDIKQPSDGDKKTIAIGIGAVCGIALLVVCVVLIAGSFGKSKGSVASTSTSDTAVDVGFSSVATVDEESEEIIAQEDTQQDDTDAEIAAAVQDIEDGISNYNDEEELAAALDAYKELAAKYGNTGGIGSIVFRLYNTYGEMVADRVEAINAYEPSAPNYKQMQSDLSKALDYVSYFETYSIGVSSDRLEGLQLDVSSRYKARLIDRFDTCAQNAISQNGKLSRSELWKIMEGVNEIDLYLNEDEGIDYTDTPIAPSNFDLHARYELAYALHIDSENESRSTAEAITAIYDFLLHSDYFCPYLVYRLYEYGDPNATDWVMMGSYEDPDFKYISSNGEEKKYESGSNFVSMSKTDKLNYMFDYYTNSSCEAFRMYFSTAMTDLLINGVEE